METMREHAYYDVLVVGAGVAGLNCAAHLPAHKRVLVVCKGGLRESDSFLAQGGICVLRDKADYRGYFEDTMRAGHFENDPFTVRCMIENSRDTVEELISLGVRFARAEDGSRRYTREGAHSRPRILFHEDCTGKEITSRLLAGVQKLPNVKILPHTTMLDLVCGAGEDRCYGAVLRDNRTGETYPVYAGDTVLATGGVGGLFRHSTNYRILTGDGLAACLAHGVAIDHADYVQIHPTTLYTKGRGRRFLVSESVRGEGAILVNADGKRFVDELLPRDAVTEAILREMQREGSDHVRLDLRTVEGGAETIRSHFPGILKRCREEGYDPLSEPIPVVPAQHYFMGGIRSDLFGRTTMPHLYAVGETCCNGVHGKNRLASNSLLESLIFAKHAAEEIARGNGRAEKIPVELKKYENYRKFAEAEKRKVLKEINRETE